MTHNEYEKLKGEILALHHQGKIPSTPTREEKIDWAFGNAVIENPEVTIEMVTRAVDASKPVDDHAPVLRAAGVK